MTGIIHTMIKPMVVGFLLLELELFSVIGVGFENTRTISGNWNASRVVPRLYGSVYKTLRLSTAVERSVVVMTEMPKSKPSSDFFLLLNLCSELVGASNFEILVENSDTGSPSSITEYLECVENWGDRKHCIINFYSLAVL